MAEVGPADGDGAWDPVVEAWLPGLGPQGDVTPSDPSVPRQRRWFLRWAIPLLVLVVAALVTKVVSEVAGEPSSLESAAFALVIAAGVYAGGSLLLGVLGAVVWLPIAHALGVHRRPCPWCGLTTDPRDPECRHCHRPLVRE